MIRAGAILSMLVVTGVPNSAFASEQPSSPVSKTEFGDRAIGAFNEICLRNRGSWDAMKQAVESSALGFQRTRGKGRQQVDYLAFPIEVSLKRWGQGYLCLVQSVVEQEMQIGQFATRLNADGFGISDVKFEATREGLSGKLPGTQRSTGAGTFFTEVRITKADSPLQGTQIIQLVIVN